MKYDIKVKSWGGTHRTLSSDYDTYEDAEADVAVLCRLTPWGYVWEDGGYLWDVYIDSREEAEEVEIEKEEDIMSKKNELITVVVVKPDQVPETKQISDSLESLQHEVGGYIEIVYPWDGDDNVCLICNEEGKLEGLPLNRALCDSDGEIYDIIAGTFVIAGDGENGDLVSLTDTQIAHYTNLFYRPEAFTRYNGEIKKYYIN